MKIVKLDVKEHRDAVEWAALQGHICPAPKRRRHPPVAGVPRRTLLLASLLACFLAALLLAALGHLVIFRP